jgi:eukaryotic-like serine/threonine-protein kinase
VTPAARAAVQAHLTSCEDCTSGLQHLDGQLASPGAPFAPPADITRSLPERLSELPPAEQVHSGPQVQRIGPYILLEQLGAGAVGSVYAAYHPQLDRQVAVKLLHSKPGVGSSDSQAPERLLREAQALAQLSHPHVVAVHDAGTWEGRVFMVMEQVPGMDLRAWLKEKPRTWREVRDVFVQAGEGLGAAHAAGLVHRDFKPPNVLVGKDGRVRVADFGLARSARGAEARSERRTFTPGGGIRIDTTLTQAGFAVGTLAYMAPEQLLGLPADARTDQFAFCVSLWEALYGKRPWAETIPGTPRGPRIEPIDTRGTPVFFRALLDRGLAEEPSHRFASMDALLDALKQDPEARSRRRTVGIGLGTAMLGVVALGAFGLLRQREAAARVCLPPFSAFAGTWNEETKGRLRTAFAATQVAWASETFGRVEKAVDGYVEQWEQLDRRLCEATLVHRTQSEETRRLQSACLDRRRGEVEALVTQLHQVDAQMVDRAVSAAAGLTKPEGCADTKRLAHEPPGPIDARNAQAVADWRNALQQAQAQVLLGKYAEGEATALDVVTKAEGAQEPAPAAVGLNLVAFVKSCMGREDESVRFGKKAFDSALAGRDDVVAFRAANSNAHSLVVLGKAEEARQWLAASQAILERVGATPELNVSAVTTRFVFALQGLGGDSTRLAEEAVAAAKLAFGEDDPKTHSAMANQAVAYDEVGRFEESVAINRKLVSLFESTYGPSNPQLVLVLGNLGGELQSLGRLDESLAVHRRAYDLAHQAFGESNEFTLRESANLSFILRKLGRADEAYPQLVKVLEAARASQGTTPLFGFALAQRGWLEFVRSDFKAARLSWEQARALSSTLVDTEDVQRECEDGMGQLELAAGRPARAVPLLEKAVALREKTQSTADDIALTRFALAQALSSTPQGTARAKVLLEKAQQALTGVSFRQRELEQVTALLAQLRAK